MGRWRFSAPACAFFIVHVFFWIQHNLQQNVMYTWAYGKRANLPIIFLLICTLMIGMMDGFQRLLYRSAVCSFWRQASDIQHPAGTSHSSLPACVLPPRQVKTVIVFQPGFNDGWMVLLFFGFVSCIVPPPPPPLTTSTPLREPCVFPLRSCYIAHLFIEPKRQAAYWLARV